MTQHPEEGTLHGYIDGDLSAADAAAVELHVGGCVRCAAALAEARGFVAAASHVITTLDAAPSSAAKPAVPLIAKSATRERTVRPPIFRVPYARAAALLLLVGGTAFVVDRSGAFARGKSTQTESVLADAAAGSETAAAAFTRRGVAGGVATKDGALEFSKPTAFKTAPMPPTTMDARVQERAVTGALNPVPSVLRYRTRDGIVVTLTEEPLRKIRAEESVATVQSALPPAQRMPAAAMAAQPINSYRWTSAERGKTYTLSGPLTVAALEALSKRVSELERVP